MKHALLIKTILIILLTIVLSATLTAVLFMIFGTREIMDMRVADMQPEAEYCARVFSYLKEDELSTLAFNRIMAEQAKLLGDGEIIIMNSPDDVFGFKYTPNINELYELIKPYMETVFNGENVADVSVSDESKVIVGAPAFGMGFRSEEIKGAVFIIKPLNEITSAMHGMISALIVSMLAVSIIMVLPAYLASKGITRPIEKMIGVAQALAHGDFSVKAHVKGKDELSSLGSAINDMSDELSQTIADLETERNRLSVIMEGIGDGIASLDEGGGVTYCNSAAAELLETGGACANALEKCVKRLKEINASVTEYENIDGKTIKLSVTPLDGNESAVALLQDITETSRLEQTRREYVANVSHELRTPLASIRSLADALNDGLIRNEADRQRYYGFILKETMRMSRLVDDLLELSRLQSGNVALEKKRFDVSEFIYDAYDRMKDTALEHGKVITLETVVLRDKKHYIVQNHDRMEQVLIILLDNAIKHSDPDSVGISLVFEVNDGQAAMRVTNKGTIGKEDIGHLFERFYKVDKSHSGDGTGLGLAIASEIAALLGGRISAVSEGGTVMFEAVFPCGEEG